MKGKPVNQAAFSDGTEYLFLKSPRLGDLGGFGFQSPQFFILKRLRLGDLDDLLLVEELTFVPLQA
jgi:hypothetical protein